MGMQAVVLRKGPIIRLAGGATHEGEAIPVASFGFVFGDAVIQRLAADTTLQIGIQDSDDGVTWNPRQFTSTVSLKAGSPIVRSTLFLFPARRFGRVQIVNTGGNEVFRIEIPANDPGEIDVDTAALSGQAIGTKPCVLFGGLGLHDGPMVPNIPLTCNCPVP